MMHVGVWCILLSTTNSQLTLLTTQDIYHHCHAVTATYLHPDLILTHPDLILTHCDSDKHSCAIQTHRKDVGQPETDFNNRSTKAYKYFDAYATVLVKQQPVCIDLCCIASGTVGNASTRLDINIEMVGQLRVKARPKHHNHMCQQYNLVALQLLRKLIGMLSMLARFRLTVHA